jgi:hypothetical protein
LPAILEELGERGGGGQRRDHRAALRLTAEKIHLRGIDATGHEFSQKHLAVLRRAPKA